MSDDNPPAPLRLKPRIKSDGDNAPAAPVVPPADVPESSATAEAPRLKLRPKLDTSSPAESTTANPPTPASADALPPPSLGLRPRSVVAQPDTIPAPAVEAPAPVSQVPPAMPPPIAPPDQPKFKLKEKAAVESAPTPAGAASPVSIPPILKSAPAPIAMTPPPFPAAATASATKTSPGLPPPRVKPPTETTTVDATDPGQSSFAKIILVVAAFVLIVGVYYGYRKLTAKSAAPVPPVAEAAKRPSTPSKTLNDLSAMPAQAIAKAEAVVAAVNANENGRVDEVLADQEMPVRPPRKTAPKPAEKAPPPTTSTTDLAPGVRATTTVTDVDGDASPAFRTWVAQARISGVFQGTPARALINGKTVPAGQIVDETLGITFEGLDPTAKLLIFRDASGVSVTRKF